MRQRWFCICASCSIGLPAQANVLARVDQFISVVHPGKQGRNRLRGRVSGGWVSDAHAYAYAYAYACAYAYDCAYAYAYAYAHAYAQNLPS